MEPIAEDAVQGHDLGQTLQTLTSGRKRDVRGGAFQAHICVVRSAEDIEGVMDAFRQAEAFNSVTSWSYAYRICLPAPPPIDQRISEASEDGLDEGCGQKILSVLRRFALQGLLLVISRWQDYGACSGLDLYGTEIYGIVIERCKDLVTNLKKAMGLTEAQAEVVKAVEKPPPGPKNFDFGFLPPLTEPRVPNKFGPNHFLSDSSMNRPASLPHLFSGGDVRLWMSNDRILRELPEAEIWAMRALRQPDYRIERVLLAVAKLRGQEMPASVSTPAARWGHYREVLRSPTLRTELLLFDANTASVEAAQCALELLRGLDLADVRRASPGAAALYEWAEGIARWRLDGPPPQDPEEDQVDGIPLRPLRPREAELRRSASSPMLRRSTGSLRQRRCFASGDGAFRKHVPAPARYTR